MSYRIEESQWNDLISKITKFDDALRSRENYWEERRQQEEIRRVADEVQSENLRLKRWRDSLEAKDLVAKSKELDEREAEIEKKRKEIEDLAYNKGYVAGYVEITQKLGKTT